jgi:DNA-binding transcriptional regulator YdaS (Cro superfamily)
MKLNEYIESFPREVRHEVRKQLAHKLGISEVYVRSMCNGSKRILEKWAVPIEKATHGKVTRQDVCPHLYE